MAVMICIESDGDGDGDGGFVPGTALMTRKGRSILSDLMVVKLPPDKSM